jgi:Domain of unknown function (DUF4166)
VPEIWHRALNALAFLVRLRLLPSLAPFAPLMHWTMERLAFGAHRGGMFVVVAGAGADGERIERSWHLVAEGDDGPLIPSMAAAAIIRRCLAGKPPAPGARAAATDLELADYDALFVGRRIATGYRQEAPASEPAPLYRRMLGEAWDLLPPPIRTMHSVSPALCADGRASIERGQGAIASLVARFMRFPPAGEDVPVTVTFRARGRGEHWARAFDKATFSSVQMPGRGRFDGLICERFGPFSFGLALVVTGERLWLVVRGWSFLGIPLPLAWAPRGDAYESAEHDCFNFHVEIGHPFLGLIVRYRGWLKPCP